MHPKAPIASIPLLSGVLLTATLFSNVTTAQTLNTKDIQSIVDSAVKPLMAEYAIPGAVIGITIEVNSIFTNMASVLKPLGKV